MSKIYSTFIQIELVLPDPGAEDHSKFEELTADNLAGCQDSERQYLALAVATLEATATDLKAGLSVCRAAVESGEQLQYSAVAEQLNQMLDARDFLNKCEEGVLTFPLIASWLALDPISVRLFLAGAYQLEAGPAPRHFLKLPASFYAALSQIKRAPAEPEKPFRATASRPLRPDAPQLAAQPALAGVFCGWARSSAGAARKAKREAA